MTRSTKIPNENSRSTRPSSTDPLERGEFTQVGSKRPGILNYAFDQLSFDLPSLLLEQLNDRMETWRVLRRSYSMQWASTTRRAIELTVSHLYTDLGFSCALDRAGHRYAITPSSDVDFVPAVGQVIKASVRAAFVEEAECVRPSVADEIGAVEVP